MFGSTIRLQSFVAKSISPDSALTRLFFERVVLARLSEETHRLLGRQ
jgi:hypothetical protein